MVASAISDGLVRSSHGGVELPLLSDSAPPVSNAAAVGILEKHRVAAVCGVGAFSSKCPISPTGNHSLPALCLSFCRVPTFRT
jgi:hypothetical protein